METKNLLNKKITQWLLLVAMLIGCSASALASNIYITAPGGTKINVYTWSGCNQDGSGNWPGKTVVSSATAYDQGGFYSFTSCSGVSSYSYIINNSSQQTGNLSLSEDTWGYYNNNTSFSVLMKNSTLSSVACKFASGSISGWGTQVSATWDSSKKKFKYTCSNWGGSSGIDVYLGGTKFLYKSCTQSAGNYIIYWDPYTGNFTFESPCTDPTATQYPMTNATKTYGSVSAPTITPASGAGTVKTIYYTGVSPTSYSKSSTLPTNAGTYKVTVDVNAGSTYCAKNSIDLTGNFVINKATQSALTFSGSTQCVEASVTLSATGGSSGQTITYAKKSGEGTVSGTTLTTSTAGNVVVTATCPGGTNYNDVTADATFTFVAKPVAGTVTGGGDICTAGKGTQTQTLTVAGYSGSIQWQKADSESGSYSDISSATSTTYVADAAGWYRVKVSNAQCDPVYSNAVEVVGYSSTVAGNVSGTTTICSGESATLTASGYKGTIKYWMVSTDGGSNWTNLTGETSSTYTPTNITTTSKYKVSVNGICGSGGSGSATVTVNPLNNVSNITFSPASIKKSETTQATATVTTVGGTGTWSTTTSSLISFTSTSANPTTITANGIGTAKVTYTLTGGCSGTGAVNSKTVDLVINSDCDVPSAGTISGTTAICAGGSVSLSVTGYTSTNTTLQWNKNGSPVAGKTSSTYTESNVTESATYTVTVTRTDVDNCSKTTDAGYEVTVTQIPTISSKSDGERCGTGTVTLGATASAGTINWYAAQTGGTSLGTGTSFTTPSISTNTTYYVSATQNNCTTASRTAVTATVKTVPSIGSISKSADDCGAGNITFQANSVTAGATVTWYENSSSLGTGNSYTFTAVPAGTSHTVKAKASKDGCESGFTSELTGTRKAVPSLTVTAPSAAYGWENATFTVTGEGTITGSVTQTAGSGGIINDKTFKGHVGDTFRASYTATGDNGCTTQKSAEVTVEKAAESCD